MNVLSLFDGISAGQIALNRAGIKYDKYFASEIDKHAIKVTQANYPKTIQLGDVTKVKAVDLPKIDILIGGSPCQGFSRAGEQLNFNDPRSRLLFEYVRLLKECQSIYFLLENVNMRQEYKDTISNLLGVQGLLINSSLLSAQNRDRVYWVNIPNVTLPIDKKVKLKDIIQENYDGIWVYPRGTNKGGVKDYHEKSPSVTTSSWQHNFLIYSEISGIGLRGTKKDGKYFQIPTMRKDEKSNTITAQYRGKTDFLYQKGQVRMFTPLEAERLQTIPDNYTSCLSDNQRFKCIGNSFTVDVIAHILSHINHGS